MRKPAKRGLRSNEQLFRSIFENAQIGISVFGFGRREHYSNRTMGEMLGYREEELSVLEKCFSVGETRCCQQKLRIAVCSSVNTSKTLSSCVICNTP